MKFSCNTNSLKKAISIVEKNASRKVNLPILSSILITAEKGKVTLTTTNLEIATEAWVNTNVLDEGKTAIPAQVLAMAGRADADGGAGQRGANLRGRDDLAVGGAARRNHRHLAERRRAAGAVPAALNGAEPKPLLGAFFAALLIPHRDRADADHDQTSGHQTLTGKPLLVRQHADHDGKQHAGFAKRRHRSNRIAAQGPKKYAERDQAEHA